MREHAQQGRARHRTLHGRWGRASSGWAGFGQADHRHPVRLAPACDPQFGGGDDDIGHETCGAGARAGAGAAPTTTSAPASVRSISILSRSSLSGTITSTRGSSGMPRDIRRPSGLSVTNGRSFENFDTSVGHPGLILLKKADMLVNIQDVNAARQGGGDARSS